MINNRNPNLVRIHSVGSSKGVNCCCFQCFTCFNFQFLKTQAGKLKIIEAILGSFCQTLALNFGLPYAGQMGNSYYGFLTTASWCLITTLLLLFCYIFSMHSFSLIRQSLFETAFNTVACFSYLSSGSYLGFIVNQILYPLYTTTPYFQVYPAMTGSFILGTLAGIVHGYDAYKSYRYYKGYR